MNLQECLNKREIIQEYESIDIKYKGVNYTITIGDKFKMLEVVKLVQYLEGSTKRKGCICKCECGNYIGPSRLYMLLSEDLVSCGCYCRELHKEMMVKRNTKHGDSTRDSRTKLYTIWAAMIDRANNLNRPDAKYYAEKGIEVCNEWNSYECFKDWAIQNGYKDGLSIDRKDNSLGYNPDNCRWIPLKLQNSNKTNNRILSYNGVEKTITEWSRVTGRSWSVINRALNNGKSVGQALGFEK